MHRHLDQIRCSLQVSLERSSKTLSSSLSSLFPSLKSMMPALTAKDVPLMRYTQFAVLMVRFDAHPTERPAKGRQRSDHH